LEGRGPSCARIPPLTAMERGSAPLQTSPRQRPRGLWKPSLGAVRDSQSIPTRLCPRAIAFGLAGGRTASLPLQGVRIGDDPIIDNGAPQRCERQLHHPFGPRRPTPGIGFQRPCGLWWGESERGKAPLGPTAQERRRLLRRGPRKGINAPAQFTIPHGHRRRCRTSPRRDGREQRDHRLGLHIVEPRLAA